MSFAVRKGEIVGFLGPNGAGKTTTMRMIAGYTTADDRAASRSPATTWPRRTRMPHGTLGYVPEQPPLYDVLDVSSYLRFVARVKGVPARRDCRADSIASSARAASRRVATTRDLQVLQGLSTARRPGAGAARRTRRCCLLDEPTAGLDPGQIQETREVIRAFGEIMRCCSARTSFRK